MTFYQKIFLTGLLTTLLSSCNGTGSTYTPIVDSPGSNYQKDLKDCQNLSKQKKYLNADTKIDAAIGAVIGGLLGSTSSENALRGAALGGAFGAGNDVYATKDIKKNIIRKCLIGRGYRVLE